MLRVKDENGSVVPGLYRTPGGAIISEETEEYKRYLVEKQRLEQINNLTSDITNLKTEMSDIKTLLLAILDKANTK